MPQLRDYRDYNISFSFDFLLDGGLVGAYPTGAFVAPRAAFGFVATVVGTVIAGLDPAFPPFISVTLEPSGETVASYVFLPVAVNTVTTTNAAYIRSNILQELTVNIIDGGGTPPDLASGQFSFFTNVIPFQE